MNEPRIADYEDYLGSLTREQLNSYYSKMTLEELKEEMAWFKGTLEKNNNKSKRIGFAILKAMCGFYKEPSSNKEPLLSKSDLQRIETKRYNEKSQDYSSLFLA